jgi:hypothetical protein
MPTGMCPPTLARMLTLMHDLPPSVVGVKAHEKITSDDYKDVLVPAVEKAKSASDDGKVRILYVLGDDMPDYSAGAVWQDTKLGLGHLRSWDRIAVVTDEDWIENSIRALGWAIPGDIKVFDPDDLDDARRWITA